jgi:hypothetical protein
MATKFKEIAMVLCDRVKREAGTNKATIDGVFDRVLVTQFPSGVNCTLFLRVYPEDHTLAKIEVQLGIQGPNGVVVNLPKITLNMENGKAEGEINLKPLPIKSAGRHRLILQDATGVTASVSFLAMEAKSASTTPKN